MLGATKRCPYPFYEEIRMSMLLDASYGGMIYVVGCEHEKRLLAAFPTIQQAMRGLNELSSTGSDALSIHNITHSKCPEWIKRIVLSDTEYCAWKAKGLENRAYVLRFKASALIAEAEHLEEHALAWREPKEFPPSAPAK